MIILRISIEMAAFPMEKSTTAISTEVCSSDASDRLPVVAAEQRRKVQKKRDSSPPAPVCDDVIVGSELGMVTDDGFTANFD